MRERGRESAVEKETCGPAEEGRDEEVWRS